MRTPLLFIACLAAFAAPASAQTYRALGTEPFWSLTIERGTLTFTDAQERRIGVPAPRPRLTAQGLRYKTRRVTMTVQRGRECSDGMSDNRYADTVQVTVDGRRLSGCGGAILPPTMLAGTEWSIVSINGRSVPDGNERYRLSFEANRLNGRAGCNSFNGSYRVSRDGLQAGPLAMTRMACPGPAMAHERAVAEMLRGRVRLTYPDGRTLVMRGIAGGEIRLRRVV